MKCQFCNSLCQKAGRQKNGRQKLHCKTCKKYQQITYRYKAYQNNINPMISQLVCESVGIRGIARVLQIGINTVLRRIISIANDIPTPFILTDLPSVQVDELWTYIGKKSNEYWLAYALDKTTGNVLDFIIGKRTKATLRTLINNLLAARVKKILTDRLTHYQRLIPRSMHHYSAYTINHIERKNLSIRTHIKRLSRRTICFSRNILLLESCLKIYFWGKLTASQRDPCRN